MRKKILRLIGAFTVFCIFAMMFVGVFAQDGKRRLVDNANLLSPSEYENLSSKLDEISERQDCDIVVVTEKSIGTKTPHAYADDCFERNDYGMGEDKSGIMLLIDMEERDWDIRASAGAKAFTEAGMKYISDKFLPDLKDGNYSKAFEIFAEQCDKFIAHWKSEGKAYDKGSLPKEPLGLLETSISVAVGILLAWLTVCYMKKQLNTVAKKAQADDYVKENSLHIKNSRDIFLYSNITMTARPKSDSDSSTHRGSSGSTHVGGKF